MEWQEKAMQEKTMVQNDGRAQVKPKYQPGRAMLAP